MAPPQTSPTASAAGMIVLPIEKGFSDGDKSVWPTDSSYGTIEPVVYLKKLAMKWIESSNAQEIGKPVCWISISLLPFAVLVSPELVLSYPMFSRILPSLFSFRVLASYPPVWCLALLRLLVANWGKRHSGNIYCFIPYHIYTIPTPFPVSSFDLAVDAPLDLVTFVVGLPSFYSVLCVSVKGHYDISHFWPHSLNLALLKTSDCHKWCYTRMWLS